jgi:hypothetical protein
MAKNARVIKMASRDQRSELEELFQLDGDTFERNGIDRRLMAQLRNMADSMGVPRAAEQVGLDPTTLLRIIAGFGHCLRPATVQRLVEYFRRG